MRCYKILLWKAYLDKGLGLTNYVKYLIALFGIASLNVKLTLIIGIIYAFLSLILGRLWFYFKIIEVENEVQNAFNPFQQEVRKHIRKQNI